MEGWQGAKWECPICDAEFMAQHSLRIHLSKKHRPAMGLEPSKDDARWERQRADRAQKEADAELVRLAEEEANHDEGVRED